MDEITLNLLEARKKLNLTVDEVSIKTKIRPHILATLEEGNFTFLPPVYIISFIKTYAAFLKIPDNEIESAIQSIRKLTKYEKPPSVIIPKSDITELERQPFSFKNLKKRKLPKLNQGNLVNYILYTAIGLAVITLIYIAFFMGDSHNGSSFRNDNGIPKPDTALIKTNDKNLANFFEGQDSIIFSAKGLDTAWLRINIDGAESQQYLVVPKFEKSWVAKKFIILSLGNAGAVEFKRDGAVLPPFGNKGNVIRNVKITKNQVISSSNPWAAGKDSSYKATVKKPAVKKQAKPPDQPRLIEPSDLQKSYKPFEKKK